jgi:arylsulfatase A-like enzyme
MKAVIHVILGCILATSAARAADFRTNVILIMADDMGYGDPSYISTNLNHPDAGWIRTPNLDAMAANGLRFDRFYSASAVCSPTRASCLTGRNPFRVGVPTANAGHLGRDESALSERLAAAGYRCGHFGKWHLGTLTTLRYDANRGAPGETTHYSAPWHSGYDTCFVTESKVPSYHPYRKANNAADLPVDFADPNFYGTHFWRMPSDTNAWDDTSGEGDVVPVDEINNSENGDDSRLLMNHALDFIRSAVAEGKPFFTVVWFHTPHKPLVDPEGISSVDSSDAAKDAIENLDEQVGRLRAELEALNVKDNTMVWFTSDNGPENGVDSPNETDTSRSLRSGLFRGRKRDLWEGGVREPGILEWPAKVAAGQVTDFPAVTSDYYPTILDYCQIPLPANQKAYDGISLRGVIEGTETIRTRPIGFLFSSKRSWVTHRHKLISTDDGSTYELYDLLTDPTETNNIAAANPALAAQLQGELTNWIAAVESDTVYPADPAQTDADSDGLKDAAETRTGIYLSLNDTGTNPDRQDTDRDGFDDYDEITRYQTDPNDAADFPNRPPPAPATELAPSMAVVAGLNATTNDPATAEVNDNWPESGNLFIRERGTGSSELQRQGRLFVHFDLSGIPTNSPIQSARLRLHQFNKLNSTATSSAITLAAVSQSWSNSPGSYPLFSAATGPETIVGYNTDFGTAKASSGFHGGTNGVDITSMVANWHATAASNHGLRVAFASDTLVGTAFSENNDPATDENESFKLLISTGSIEDSDSDGLPDWWELKYFNTLNDSDGNGNQDGDSFTDRQEYIIGGDPKTKDSGKLELVASNQTMKIDWDSAPGRDYRLEASTNLNTWMPAFHALEGNGLKMSIETPSSGMPPKAFYRQRISVD